VALWRRSQNFHSGGAARALGTAVGAFRFSILRIMVDKAAPVGAPAFWATVVVWVTVTTEATVHWPVALRDCQCDVLLEVPERVSLTIAGGQCGSSGRRSCLSWVESNQDSRHVSKTNWLVLLKRPAIRLIQKFDIASSKDGPFRSIGIAKEEGGYHHRE